MKKLADIWMVVDVLKNRSSDDPDRRRLAEIALEIIDVEKRDLAGAAALCQEGRAVAERCGAAWWVLYYEHRRIQLLLKRSDYVAAREAALPAVVEARKPQYGECPQRICLHEDVIRVYLGIDPLGYAPQIAEALAYMDREVPPDLSCRFCHDTIECSFHYALGAFERAEELALRNLEATQDDAHYRTFAYLKLCAVGHRRDRWQQLLGWAREAEQSAEQSSQPGCVATALAWQAAALRREGRDDEALQAYRNAEAKAAALLAPPSETYYDALYAYHEQRGEYGEALALRRAQLEPLRGTGQSQLECDVRLAICRLHRQLGRPWAEEAAALRAAAQGLLDPARVLGRLADLEGAVV